MACCESNAPKKLKYAVQTEPFVLLPAVDGKNCPGNVLLQWVQCRAGFPFLWE